MGIHDKVKQLSGYQEESTAATAVEGEQAPTVRERKTVEPVSSETDRLEKLLFKFGAMIEKVEAERQEMKKLSLEVEVQKDTVGKLAVALDGAIKSFPDTVDTSVKASLSETAVNLNSAVQTICGQIGRHISHLTNRIPSELNQSLGNAATIINAVTDKAAATVTAIEEEKNSIALWTIAVSVLVSFLVTYVLIGVVNRRLPWHLGGPTTQERIQIEKGKAVDKLWSQFPPKVQSEISKALTDNE